MGYILHIYISNGTGMSNAPLRGKTYKKFMKNIFFQNLLNSLSPKFYQYLNLSILPIFAVFTISKDTRLS